MNDYPSAPSDSILPPPAESLGWIDTMIKAVTQPNETAYTQIANDPGLSVSRAALWYFLSALLAMFFSMALSFVFNSGFFQLLQQPEFAGGNAASFMAGYAGVALCAVPFMAIFSTLWFMFWVAIVQVIARLFGGQGSFAPLFHTYSAFMTPLLPVVTLISSIPFVGCLGIFISFYLLYLQVLAVKAANRFGWGPAVGAVLVPIIVMFAIFCCLAIAVASLLGPVIGNTFNNIQQQLITTPQY